MHRMMLLASACLHQERSRLLRLSWRPILIRFGTNLDHFTALYALEVGKHNFTASLRLSFLLLVFIGLRAWQGRRHLDKLAVRHDFLVFVAQAFAGALFIAFTAGGDAAELE